jgi:hypothetical protein
MSLREQLLNHLKSQVCDVTFTKADGTIRNMKATLEESHLPPPTPPKEGAKPRAENLDLINVWDTEAAGWRSFRLDSLISFAYGTADTQIVIEFGDVGQEEDSLNEYLLDPYKGSN